MLKKGPRSSMLPVYRDNLYLVVQLKIDQMKDLREELPVKNGQLDLGGSVIIYCPTKKVTEAVTNTVKCKYNKA